MAVLLCLVFIMDWRRLIFKKKIRINPDDFSPLDCPIESTTFIAVRSSGIHSQVLNKSTAGNGELYLV